MEADLELSMPEVRNTRLGMSVKTHNVNPGEIFWGGAGDSIPDFLNGSLNGSFHLDLHFPDDEMIFMEKLDLHQADLHFINAKDTFRAVGLNLLARDVYWDTGKHPNLFHTLNAVVEEHIDILETDYFEAGDLNHDIVIKDGVFQVKTDKSLLLESPGQGEYTIAPFGEFPYYRVKLEMEELDVNDLMSTFRSDTLIAGTMDLKLDITTKGREMEEILEGINGELVLYGEDLTLYGIDLDGMIKQFKRSQNFNLVDVGAVMFAGPAGLALTKGGAYASMLVIDHGESSPVSEIISDWEFQNGTIMLRDVAFATRESRVAAKGWLDFRKDSLDISFAVIDKKGCNVIGQDLYGSIKAPEKSKIRIIPTLLAPVTNLLELTLGIDCEPFYLGRISHPEKDR
jgi:AsmA protein